MLLIYTNFKTQKALTLRVALPKKGVLLPYLTLEILYELLAFDSQQTRHGPFVESYHKFLAEEGNEKYIVQNLTLGICVSPIECLNSEGLVKFASSIKNQYQFCPLSVHNFMIFCMRELELVTTGKSQIKENRTQILSRGRELPIFKRLPAYPLYEKLVSDNTLNVKGRQKTELQRVLG